MGTETPPYSPKSTKHTRSLPISINYLLREQRLLFILVGILIGSTFFIIQPTLSRIGPHDTASHSHTFLPAVLHKSAPISDACGMLSGIALLGQGHRKVTWPKPPEGFVGFYVDGHATGVNTPEMRVGIGGVLVGRKYDRGRKRHGELRILQCFQQRLLDGKHHQDAEERVVFKAKDLLEQLKCKKAIIYTDNDGVRAKANLIFAREKSEKKGEFNFEDLRVERVDSKANNSADKLAKEACELQHGNMEITKKKFKKWMRNRLKKDIDGAFYWQKTGNPGKAGEPAEEEDGPEPAEEEEEEDGPAEEGDE